MKVLEVVDLIFKLCVCAFMVITISRERDHYRYLKELHEELNKHRDRFDEFSRGRYVLEFCSCAHRIAGVTKTKE